MHCENATGSLIWGGGGIKHFNGDYLTYNVLIHGAKLIYETRFIYQSSVSETIQLSSVVHQ